MSLKSIQVVFFIYSIGISFDACEKASHSSENKLITYTNEIQVLLSDCTTSGCHHKGAPSHIKSLADYDDVISFANSSRIIGSLRHDAGFEPMPRGHNKWTQEQISMLVQWFKNGTPE